MALKVLWVREPYLTQILTGRKRIEVRVGYDNIRRLEPGDQLRLNDQHPVTIRRIARYADFEDLLVHENPADIAPDSPEGELLLALRQLYPRDKEALGAIALELSLPRRYDAILFDMGFTLVYFEPEQVLAVQQGLRALGHERSAEEIDAAASAVYAEYYKDAATATFPATQEQDHETQQGLERKLLERLGLETDPETVETYSSAVEAWFGRPNAIRTYPEVVAVLDFLLERGYRLGIVSNWSWNLRRRVAQVELESYFEVIWASAYAGCNKPHPDIFHQALARMVPPQVLPNRTLYVGDSYWHDVVGARNAGLDAVLLDRNGRQDQPDCPVIRDLSGLFALLGEPIADHQQA